MRGSLVRRARHWIANRGWKGFLAEVWRRTRLAVRGLGQHRSRAAMTAQHPFDQRYGVDTGGLIFGEHLDVPRADAFWATAYYGIAPSVLWAALDRLALDWERFTFLDIGCGKGRALLLATRYPFREAVGIELSPHLARIADTNLQHFHADWRQHVPVRIVCGDATKTPLPAGPLVLSLYHPFAAPVMRQFLAALQASMVKQPREIWILYTNPELAPMLRVSGWLEEQWVECFGMSEEDRAADRFGSEWEKVAAYRAVTAGNKLTDRVIRHSGQYRTAAGTKW